MGTAADTQRRVVLDNRGRQVWADSALAPTAPQQRSPWPFRSAQDAANPHRAPCGRLRIGPEDVS